MKRMIDQASFEKASSDIKEIQDVLSGKAFFDGSVTVVTIGGDKGIKKENLPITAGVYKLSSGGVLCVDVNSASSITLTAIYKDNMYTETRDPNSTADLKFIEANRMGDKPLYFHPVVINDANAKIGFGLVILNNSSAPLDTWDKVKEYLFSIMQSIGDTARFPATGSFTYNDEIVSCRNIDVTTTNVIRIYGYNSSSINVYRDIENFSIGNVYDGVNRIN